MSKISKKQQEENDAFRAKHRENSEKVRDAGFFIGKTYGMGRDNYYFHEGRAYDSHAEAVDDIVKRKNL